METACEGLSSPKCSLHALSSCGLGVSRQPLQDSGSEEGSERLCSEPQTSGSFHLLIYPFYLFSIIIIAFVHLYSHFPNTLILLFVFPNAEHVQYLCVSKQLSYFTKHWACPACLSLADGSPPPGFCVSLSLFLFISLFC